jgi:hypothetical protein
MISTGTRAITTLASEKRVESSKPNEELINPHNSRLSNEKKKTPASLFRLQGK